MEQEHKRRVRYKGTHPRKFEEKYKELNPEKYSADVEKIVKSGKTPAGMHISIMVDEILEFLDIQPGQIGLDATLGYGGHSRRMLEKLQGQGHLYATDIDPIESEKTRLRLAEAGYGPEILTIRRMNFARLDEVAPETQFDFVLADLGVDTVDEYLTTIEFRNGGIAQMENGWITPNANPCVNDIKFNVLGTKGMISLDLSNHNMIQMYTDDKVTVPDVLVQDHIFGSPKGFAFESIRGFVDCVLEDKPFPVTLEDAANTSLAILAIMESAEKRMPVEVDLPY